MTIEDNLNTLSARLNDFTEVFQRYQELQERSIPIAERRLGIDKKSTDEQENYNKKVAQSYKDRLGVEEELNPKYKKALD